MKKVQRISLVDFVQWNYTNENFVKKAKQHITKNKSFYITVSGYTVFFICCAFDGVGYASTGIDVGARKLYRKVCDIGKWAIVVKGGIDVVNTVLSGDMTSLKTKILSYVVAFISLLGLPWLLDQVELMFNEAQS